MEPIDNQNPFEFGAEPHAAPPSPTTEHDELQFTTVEPPASAASAPATTSRPCSFCRQPIDSIYYALADKTICESCRAKIDASPAGTPFGRFFKATMRGLGAGLLGAIAWFAIRKIAHIEIGLVAIVVGFMVGKAVRKGSGGRGGRGYQILAVVLTYSCIAANYMPDIFEAVINDIHHPAHSPHSARPANGAAPAATPNQASGNDASSPSPGSPSPATTAPRHVGAGKKALALMLVVVLVFVMSLALPFMEGVKNLIGLLIIGFALWEAWKINAFRRLPITGPYQIAPLRRTLTANPGSSDSSASYTAVAP
jgi:hypothetical protein